MMSAERSAEEDLRAEILSAEKRLAAVKSYKGTVDIMKRELYNLPECDAANNGDSYKIGCRSW